MVALPHGALVEAVGWALIHSLWEFAVGGLLVGFLMLVVPGRLSRVRYGAMMMVLVAMAALPVGSVARVLLRPEEPVSPITFTLEPGPALGVPLAEPAATVQTAREADQPQPVDYLPWLVAAYLVGAAACAGRLAAGYWRLRPLRRSGEQAGPELAARVRRLAGRLGVRVRYGLRVTAAVGSPVVMGIVRPLILVPAEAVATLAAEQLDALLAHELAHLRRWDHVFNFLQTLIETLLFYHPAVWWISARIRQEREHCADDLAVRALGDRRGYVAALEAMERLRPEARLALAASGGNLLVRARRLLGMAERGSAVKRRVSGLSAACLVLGVVLMLVYAIGCHATSRPVNTVDTAAVKKAHEAAGRQKLRAAQVIVKADGQPLEQVLQDIARQADVKMDVRWAELAKQGVSRQTPISITMRNISAEKALLEISSNVKGNLAFREEDRLLVISTLADFAARTPLVDRTWDIRDMLASAPQLNAGKLELPSASGPVVEVAPFADSAQTAEVAKEVIDTVKLIVAPDSWAPAGRGQIREVNGDLLVRQTEENQTAVLNLLNQLAETRSIKISLETRLFVVSEAEYQALTPKGFALTMPAGTLGAVAVTGSIVDNFQVKNILEQLDGDKSVVQDAVPPVTNFNGYPVEFRYGALPNITRDSVGAQVLKGAQAAVQSTASADRRYVVCQIRMNVPAGAASTTADPRPDGKTATPTTTLVAVPDGGTLITVMGHGKTQSGETRYVVQMLRPRIVVNREPTSRPPGNPQ